MQRVLAKIREIHERRDAGGEFDQLLLRHLALGLELPLPELVLITGLIPYFKMGKAVRFRVADVAAVIERMRIG